MKLFINVIFAVILCLPVFSQNNTFPLSGNAGIGTSFPNYSLDILGNNPGFRIKTSALSGENFLMGVANCNGCFSQLASTGDVVFRAATTSNDFLITNTGIGSTVFATGGFNNETERMVITVDGNIGIGKSNPTDKLEVNGRIHARSVKVDLDAWPDYVFVPEYRLKSLEEVEFYIKKHGHLENVPSADEITVNGLDLGQMDTILMEKIEELTLYLIEKEKEINSVQEEKQALEQRVQKLEELVKALAIKIEE